MTAGAWSPAGVVALFFLAGCVADTNAAVADTDAQHTASPTASGGADMAAPGGIDGSVVDDEARPVPEAEVSLFPVELFVRTNADGRFGFAELPSGTTYTLRVAKLGYEAAETLVRIDEAEVETVTISLKPLPVLLAPRLEVLGPFDGYLQCHMSITVFAGDLGGTSNGKCGTFPIVGDTPLTSIWSNDQSAPVPFELTGPDWRQIVLEAAWQPASAASKPQLVQYFSYRDRQCDHYFDSTVPGNSPLQIVYTNGVNGTQRKVYDRPEDPVECQGQPIWPNAGLTLTTWVQIPNALWYLPVEFAMDVRYQIIMSVFYSMDAPPGYTAFEP